MADPLDKIKNAPVEQLDQLREELFELIEDAPDPAAVEQIKKEALAAAKSDPSATANDRRPWQVPPSELGQPFFRGTVPGSTQRIDEPFEEGKGFTFVARKPESARNYGESIEQIDTLPGAKILRQEDKEFWKLLGRRRPPNGSLASVKGGMIENVNKILKKAKELNYDAVSFSQDADVGTVLLNESMFIRGGHRKQVEKALAEGRNVPPEILAAYGIEDPKKLHPDFANVFESEKVADEANAIDNVHTFVMPPDEVDQTVALVSKGAAPSVRDLPGRFNDNPDVVRQDVAREMGISEARIDRAVAGQISKRSHDSAGDRSILSKMADRGTVESGVAYRGLAFRTEEEAASYVRTEVGGGWLLTKGEEKLHSFTMSPEIALDFATHLGHQVIGGKHERNAHGVILEVSAGNKLRGFSIGGDEQEAILPREQAYRVKDIRRDVDADGWVTFWVKLKHDTNPEGVT